MTIDAISARLRELRAQVIRECCLIEGELRRFGERRETSNADEPRLQPRLSITSNVVPFAQVRLHRDQQSDGATKHACEDSEESLVSK